MSGKSDFHQLSEKEQTEIDRAVDEDLTDHMYKSILPANIVAFFASAAIFVFLYRPYNQFYLTIWLLIFNLNLLAIGFLDHFYVKYKQKYTIQTWKLAFSVSVSIFTILWGATVLFVPQTLVNKFIHITMLLMVAAAFFSATVGSVILCIICEIFILLPLAIMFFMQDSFYYTIGGLFVFIYAFFLLGMNNKSTAWLKNSLKLSRMLATVTHSATHDSLTDLKNIRTLTKYLEKIIKKSFKSKKNFALVCFSVNRLNRFNVSLGYQAGDLIIQSLAKRLGSKIEELSNKDNTIKRVLTMPRSDTFVIVIKPFVNVESLSKEVGQLFRVLDLPFYLGKREAILTASIGISVYPTDGSDPQTLLNNAYAAMFQAKSKGGNQMEYYKKEINDKAPSILDLENDLYHALRRREFLIYYQPIIDLQTLTVSGTEALLRWNHSKRGMIYPADFIHIAEETKLIIEIGKWVLEQACIQTAQWHKLGFSNLNLKISVNLSTTQLHQHDFLEIIDNSLKTSGLDSKYLDLELTETELLDEKLASLMKEVNKKGISLSIDDFGTGYSGLSYLKYFDVDKIKIDKSFIADLPDNADSAAIVSAIFAMAKELNIKTLAEGVETRKQLDFLAEKGCNFVQGYYFSRPLDKEDITQFLKSHAQGIRLHQLGEETLKSD